MVKDSSCKKGGRRVSVGALPKPKSTTKVRAQKVPMITAESSFEEACARGALFGKNLTPERVKKIILAVRKKHAEDRG